MKNLEMLDPTMLMMHGLIDNQTIIEIETNRLKDVRAETKIKALINKCLDDQMIREALLFDESLAELFISSKI